MDYHDSVSCQGMAIDIREAGLYVPVSLFFARRVPRFVEEFT